MYDMVKRINRDCFSEFGLYNGKWFLGSQRPYINIFYKIDKVLFSKRSKYQDILIGENKYFGRILFLDGDIQIAELDADVYNKALVDPIFKAKRKLRKALIIGGGDGGVLHELLKHNVDKVYLVDIDEEMIHASVKYLKNIHKNAFSDKRVTVVIDEANNLLKASNGFDAVIYDLTMFPNFGRMSIEQYLNEIFKNVYNAMNKDGVFTAQMCAGLDSRKDIIVRLMKKYFRDIRVSKAFIRPYGENWLFASARPRKIK